MISENINLYKITTLIYNISTHHTVHLNPMFNTFVFLLFVYHMIASSFYLLVKHHF